MAWGARQHDDKTWRLCERKGRTILFLSTKDAPGVEVRFNGRAAAQKCAEALNERFWPEYARLAKKKSPPSPTEELAIGIIEVIREHKGIAE